MVARIEGGTSEIALAYRESLFAPGCNTRELRKNNTERQLLPTCRSIKKGDESRILNLRRIALLRSSHLFSANGAAFIAWRSAPQD